MEMTGKAEGAEVELLFADEIDDVARMDPELEASLRESEVQRGVAAGCNFILNRHLSLARF